MRSSDSPSAGGAPGWSFIRDFRFLILVALVACAWWFVAAALFLQWVDDPNYTHGLFVLPLAGVLAWRRRSRLATIEAQPSYAGLFVLAAAVGIYLLGILAAEFFTMRLSLVLAVYAVVLSTQGWARTRVLAFPLLFLLLMIPLPYVIYYKFTFPLQLWSSKLAAWVLSGLGMPVVRSGNVIDLEGYSLEVVTACSGLRSMMSLGTLAVFMTDFFRLGTAGKVVLVLLSVPVAIVANTARLTATAVVSAMAGAKAADSFLHEFSGVILFVSGLVLLVILGLILEWIVRRKSSAPSA
jgi:exosortase